MPATCPQRAPITFVVVTPLAFDERIHALRPFPRQGECAANLRRLLAGSELTRRDDPAHVQDAYTLRCIP